MAYFRLGARLVSISEVHGTQKLNSGWARIELGFRKSSARSSLFFNSRTKETENNNYLVYNDVRLVPNGNVAWLTVLPFLQDAVADLVCVASSSTTCAPDFER